MVGFDKLGHPGWVFAKAALFILASFVFSYIFWGTKKLMDKKPKKKK